MKKVNKSNIIMYALVVIALLMFSSTLTMAVLTDKKQGKEDIVFGKVAISGQNSLLELDIEDAVTIGTEILSQDRYLYFSPTADTQNFYARYKIEYKADSNDYDDQIVILNSTLTSPYYTSYSSNNDYKYLLNDGYYYLVDYSATEINVASMREITAEDLSSPFILCNNYVFGIAEKSDEIALFRANLLGARIKLVVTVEVVQSEGLTDLEEVWRTPNTFNLLGANNEVNPVYSVTTINDSVTIPTYVSDSSMVNYNATYNTETLYGWEDANGNIYHSGDSVPITSKIINLTAKLAGLYDKNDSNSVSIMDENTNVEVMTKSFSNLVSDGYISLNGSVTGQGSASSLNKAKLRGKMYLPEFITQIGNQSFISWAGIREIHMANNVTVIGTGNNGYVFNGCTSNSRTV